MPSDESPEYIGTAKAAELTGLTQSGVRYACSQGRVPGAVKVGRDWLVPVRWAKTRIKNRT